MPRRKHQDAKSFCPDTVGHPEENHPLLHNRHFTASFPQASPVKQNIEDMIDHSSMTLQLLCRRSESARFTTRKQQEAAEPSLLWRAKSAGEERRRRAQAKNASEECKSFRRVRREHNIHNQRAVRGCGAISFKACEEQRRHIS